MSKNRNTGNNVSTIRDINASTGAISNEASATLKSHNQTPRKVRLVTDLVKGKSVPAALAALQFLPRRAAEPVAKLIKSAAANAKERGENVDDLTVQSIIVESAGMLKKYMPRAFGRASLIRRRKSRLKVTLVSALPAKKGT
jgi:large subunit ribosomal protein L22